MVKFIELTKRNDIKVYISVNTIRVVFEDGADGCYIETDFDIKKCESVGIYVKEPYNLVMKTLFDLYKNEN